MFLKGSGSLKLLFQVCFSGFLSLFLILNAYADKGGPQAAGPVSPASYRQELGKAVVVEEEYYPQNLDAYARFIPPSKAKSQSGRLGLLTSALEYSYEIKAFGKLPIELAVATKYIGIDNSTSVELPAHLTSLDLGIETTLPFFNIAKTYLTVALAPSFYSDNWNLRSESFYLPQRYFMIYQPDEKWTFICGVQYSPGSNISVLPILGFIYKPNERIIFDLVPNNPEISYKLNNSWTVFSRLGITADEYKVTRNNIREIELNYYEMRLGIGLRYALNKNIQASFALGSVFNHSIGYQQDSMGKVALNNGFYSEFRLGMVM